jgi:type I restriction enzyme, R subunit
VFFCHRPETLRRWLAEPMTIRRRLQAMPPFLTERLRECQIDAVMRLEASLAADHPRADPDGYRGRQDLHRMRLPPSPARASEIRRVLFLADRANLVRQTRHEFEDFRPPGTAGRLPSSTTSSGSGTPVSTRMPRSSSRRSSVSIRC